MSFSAKLLVLCFTELVTLAGPAAGVGPRPVRDRRIHHPERIWVCRVYLVGVGRVGGMGGGRDKERKTEGQRKSEEEKEEGKGETDRKLPF